MSDKIDPTELFTSIIADPRFEELPPEERLGMLDDVTNDHLGADASWDEMQKWDRALKDSRFFARHGLQRGIEAQNEAALGMGLGLPPEMRTESFMEDQLVAGSKGYALFDADAGEQLEKGGSGYVQTGESGSQFNVKLMPHPTKVIAEISTPKGPRRTEFGSIDHVPKTGKEWIDFAVENYGDDFLDRSVTGEIGDALGASMKSLARGLSMVGETVPFAFKNKVYEAMASREGIDFIYNNTIDEKGNVVPIPDDLRAEIEKRVMNLAAAQVEVLAGKTTEELLAAGIKPGETINPMAREGSPLSDVERELFAKVHKMFLRDMQIPVSGDDVEGDPESIQADFRFVHLGNQKFRKGDTVSALDLAASHIAVANEDYSQALKESYAEYLSTVRAMDEKLGRNQAQFMKAQRDSWLQKIVNINQDVSKVTGQSVSSIGTAAIASAGGLGPVALGSVGYISAYGGHYGETNRAIYNDAIRQGLSEGEALIKAHDGATMAANFAAPIDAAGDAMLAGPLNKLSKAFSSMKPVTRNGMMKALARELDVVTGARKASNIPRVVSGLAAQFASEAAGELTRSEIEDSFQVNKDGFQKNLQGALYEGLLAMIATGAIQTTVETADWASKALQDTTTRKERAPKVPASSDRHDDDPLGWNMAEGLGPTALEAGFAEIERRKQEANRPNISPEFRAAPRSNPELSSTFEGVGKKQGDIVMLGGSPVRLVTAAPEQGVMMFEGVRPDGSRVFIEEGELAGAKTVSFAEAFSGTIDPDEVITFDSEPEPEAPSVPAVATEEQEPVVTDPNTGEQLTPENKGVAITPTGTVDPVATPLSKVSLQPAAKPEVNPDNTPAPEPKQEGVAGAPSISSPGPSRSFRDNTKFWTAAFGPSSGPSFAGVSSSGSLVFSNTVATRPPSAAGLAKMMGSGTSSLVIPRMSDIPVLFRPLSSGTGPRSAQLRGSTRAVYAHSFDQKNNREYEAILLDSNTFPLLSAEEQSRYLAHELRHVHVRRMIQDAGLPGASPELVKLASDFRAMGAEFIAAYEADPRAWAGVHRGLQIAVESGDALAVADELVAYALTDPSVARAMQRFGADFKPLAESKPEEGKPATLWDRIMDIFRRAFGLSGMSPQAVEAEIAALDPDTALTRIERFAGEIMDNVSGKTYASEEAATKKADKMGLPSGSFTVTAIGDGKHRISYRAADANPEDVFSGQNMHLGAATSDVARVTASLASDATADTASASFLDTATKTGEVFLGIDQKNKDFSAVLARTGVNLWNTGLRHRSVWNAALSKLYPNADVNSVWDAMNQAISQVFATGGAEGGLALRFQGDQAGLKAYQQDLASGGRAEANVKTLVASAGYPYSNYIGGSSVVNPDTALIRYGSDAPENRRFIEFQEMPGGRLEPVSTDLYKNALRNAKRLGDTARVSELMDIGLAVQKYKARAAAVRSAKYHLNHIAADRMGMLGITYDVSKEIWTAMKREGDSNFLRAAVFGAAERTGATYEQAESLWSDLKWYLKQNRIISNKSPDSVLKQGPKAQDAVKAVLSESWMQGVNDGKAVAETLLTYSTQGFEFHPNWSSGKTSAEGDTLSIDEIHKKLLEANEYYSKPGPQSVISAAGDGMDPLFKRLSIVSGPILIGSTEEKSIYEGTDNVEIRRAPKIPVPPSLSYTPDQIKELAGDRVAWKYRQGLVDGMRIAAMSAALESSRIHGDATVQLLPMLLGLPLKANSGDNVVLGRHVVPAGISFFDAVIGPALIRSVARSIDPDVWSSAADYANAIHEVRSTWESSVAHARERAGLKQGKSGKTVTREGLAEMQEQAFNELIRFNSDKFSEILKITETDPQVRPDPIALLADLRRAFGTEWHRAWDAGGTTDMRQHDVGTMSDTPGGFSLSGYSAREQREVDELRRQIGRALMYVAGYDKGKALNIAVMLGSMRGTSSDVSMAHDLEKLLLEAAVPHLMKQADRTGTRSLIPALSRFLDVSPEDAALMLSLSNAQVFTMSDAMAAVGSPDQAGQRILNLHIKDLADDTPVLVFDSSGLGEAMAQRMNLALLQGASRNVSGARFATIPPLEDAPEGSWGGAFNVMDVRTVFSESGGSVSGLMGAQNILSIESSASEHFRKEGRNALRGMAELSKALGDAYPMLLKAAELDSSQADLYQHAIAALEGLARTHGKPGADKISLSQVLSDMPAGVLATEILVNPDLRQALLVIPDIFGNNRAPMSKKTMKTARKVAEIEKSEMERRYSDSTSLDTAGSVPWAGMERNKGFSDDVEFDSFEAAADDAFNNAFGSLESVFEKVQLAEEREESTLDEGFAARQIGLALEVSRIAAQSRRLERHNPFQFALQPQDSRVTSSDPLTPVPMPLSDTIDALDGELDAESETLPLEELVNKMPTFLDPKITSRITKKTVAILAEGKQDVTPEQTFQPTPETLALQDFYAKKKAREQFMKNPRTSQGSMMDESGKPIALYMDDMTGDPLTAQSKLEVDPVQMTFRAATAPGVMVGAYVSEPDPKLRREMAEAEADDFIRSVLPPVIAREISSRPMSRQWFSDNVRFWMVDLLDHAMEPGTSNLVTDNITNAIRQGFSSSKTTVKRSADMDWHRLFDAWRAFRGERTAIQLLSATRGSINPFGFRKRLEVAKKFMSNDAIFRKLGARSPGTLDKILDLVMMMEYGVTEGYGFTGYRSATMDIEKRFNEINGALGPYAENYVLPTMIGQLMAYRMDGSPQDSVGAMIKTIETSIQNLDDRGKWTAHAAHQELGLYNSTWARLSSLAANFRDGLIDQANYENALWNMMDPRQRKWLRDTREFFDEIRPAMEVLSVITGDPQGGIENYLPLMNARMDGATATEDMNYRPIGEKVGASRVRSMNARHFDGKFEDYMADYNGSRMVNRARGALFMMKTATSNILLHDILGSVNLTKKDVGFMEKLLDPSSSRTASRLAFNDEEAKQIRELAGAMRMIFDRERTGFQSGLHIDNLLRRTMIKTARAGSYFALADLEQLYKQTLPGFVAFTNRMMLSGPKAWGAYARAIGHVVRGERFSNEVFSAMKQLAPAIYNRGLDGIEDINRKLAMELVRKSKGLDLVNRATNVRKRLSAALAFVPMQFLQWTTGKPDGVLSKLMWITEFQINQKARGLKGSDVWTQLPKSFRFDEPSAQRSAYKAGMSTEELVGQSEMTRRGALMQLKGKSIFSEFGFSALRAFGSFNVSMAAHADALWSEVAHAPTAKLKAIALGKLAEIPMQNVLFRLLSKPFRDLFLVNVGQAMFGWDEREKRRRLQQMLENDWNARKTRRIESFEDAWTRYGWRMMVESSLTMTGAGAFGVPAYYGSLPALQDIVAMGAQDGGERIKEWAGLGREAMTRDLTALDIFEKTLGYSGVTLDRAVGLASNSIEAGRRGRVRQDAVKIGVAALAMRGVAGRAQQELDLLYKGRVRRSPSK